MIHTHTHTHTLVVCRIDFFISFAAVLCFSTYIHRTS